MNARLRVIYMTTLFVASFGLCALVRADPIIRPLINVKSGEAEEQAIALVRQDLPTRAHNGDRRDVEIVHDQEFEIRGKISIRLVPISYQSKRANNRICVLAVLSGSGGATTLRLAGDQNDPTDPEVVASCLNVLEVSFRTSQARQLDVIYLLRMELVNRYFNVAIAVDLDMDRGDAILSRQLTQRLSRIDNPQSLRGLLGDGW